MGVYEASGRVPQAKSKSDVTSTSTWTKLVTRNDCARDAIKIYENHNGFPCVGKTAFWTTRPSRTATELTAGDGTDISFIRDMTKRDCPSGEA